LLGPKSLLQAAWLHSAPHHAFGRPMKVGKEEIMGMLAAVEAWVKRDHKAEWAQWEGWLAHIAARVKIIDGVRTEVLQPEGLSNNSPRLRISWDKPTITGLEAERLLATGSPKVILGGASGDRRRGGANTMTIMPYMMMPGDEKIAADRIYAVLSTPATPLPSPAAPAGIAGVWDVSIQYIAGESKHRLVFEQVKHDLQGTHSGEYLSGDLRGFVDGNNVEFQSSHPYEGTRIDYKFQGRLNGDAMSGTVDLGEYGTGQWTARRHTYRQPGGVVRPVKNV
jgi:L-seryl-tRNA(Ser) seleniumtransferase